MEIIKNYYGYYQRSFQINEKVLGPEHPSVAYSLNNLAFIYESIGEYDRSLNLFKRAFEILESKLGQNHPNSLIVKKNYESVYKRMHEK